MSTLMEFQKKLIGVLRPRLNSFHTFFHTFSLTINKKTLKHKMPFLLSFRAYYQIQHRLKSASGFRQCPLFTEEVAVLHFFFLHLILHMPVSQICPWVRHHSHTTEMWMSCSSSVLNNVAYLCNFRWSGEHCWRLTNWRCSQESPGFCKN